MKKPTQPCQPPTVCLLGFAHKCEQHHQLHDLAVMPRPIRREVTLLFLFPPLPPLGRGTTPVSEHHPPPTRRARRQGAAEPRHPARGSPAGGSPAQPGPAQPRQALRLDVHLGDKRQRLHSLPRAHSRTWTQSRCCSSQQCQVPLSRRGGEIKA